MPGDNGITQTVNSIRDLVFYGIRDVNLRRRAENIVASCLERDENSEISCLFQWVLDHYRYVRDPVGLEMVKEPGVMDGEILKQGFFQGDCDDASTYLATLLMSLGYKVKAVVIAVPGKGDPYRHIFLRVFLSKANRWLDLETTAKNKPIGWAAKFSRIREYPL